MLIRTEFWNVTDRSLAIGALALRSCLADAVDFDDDTEEPVALPVAANRASYIMAVTAVEGDATVAVGAADDDLSPARGRLVTEGNTAWFAVEPDSVINVVEYGVE